MGKDRYASELTGPKLKFNSFESSLLYVRNIFPDVYAEGSTGFERTFWVKRNSEPELVAHVWMTGRTKEVWHLRVKDYLK